MNGVRQVLPLGSTVGRVLLNKLLVMGYLTAIIVATIGWVSAFGWMTLKVATWLLA